MPNHDILIIGASAGGFEASLAIISKLPANFPAALFVVTHMSSEGPFLLPDIRGAGHSRPSTSPRATRLSRGESIALRPITTC
jgi:two-component system chemotaxis response regulator CheB